MQLFSPSIKLAISITLLILMGACGRGLQDVGVRRTIDSLNHIAYDWRYRNIDSAEYYAKEALTMASHYATGRAMSHNTLGFVAFQQMDFVKARTYFEHAQSLTRHQVVLLMSDVLLMRLCQRTSANKTFYDYHNRALERIKRISEEQQLLNSEDYYLFRSAVNDFWLTSTQYYLNLEQQTQAADAFSQLTASSQHIPDTAQLAQYYYIRGRNPFTSIETRSHATEQQREDLLQCLMLARSGKYSIFEGLVYQYYAEMLTIPDAIFELKTDRKSLYYFLNNELIDDYLLADYMAKKSFDIFASYKDLYRMADGYRTRSLCAMAQRNYTQSLLYLDSALLIVNEHHDRHYSRVSRTHPLQLFNEHDTISVEKQWIDHPHIITIPDWIAGIREQLSVTYSALDMKQYSDYNRNIYLDILEITRQDRALENRYDELNRDSRLMNFMLSLVAFLLILFFVVIFRFNKNIKKHNNQQINTLREILERCKLITSSATPTHRESIESHPSSPLEKLLRPYREWMVQNREIYQVLGHEHERLQEEFAMHKLRITENKRQNVEKRAKLTLVNGILPYLNRVVNEIDRLDNPTHREEHLCYIEELVTEINRHNDILAQWIELHQGELNLHIERFELNSLFQLIAQNKHAFAQKQLRFSVLPTEAIVKADRSLTLFMLSTLADNARKFTLTGGEVIISAIETDNYVEISVKDSGEGLTTEEIHTILDTKVYDSSEIGKHNKQVTHYKGHGFGLLNCKGIIEKYRKTNSLFHVCYFGIESEVGQGSRFYFRLPNVIKQIQVLLLLLTCCAISACNRQERADKPTVKSRILNYDEHLKLASAFADSCYYCNISGNYNQTLHYVDSAIHYLNQHYKKQYGEPEILLCGTDLHDERVPAEVIWWNDTIATDYTLILDIRNEAAVASLALHNEHGYRHHNSIYRQLYKLTTTQDHQLRHYCEAIQQANINRRVAFAIMLILGVLLLIGYYYTVWRNQLIFRFNLQQVLEINRKVLEILSTPVAHHEIHQLPQQLLQQISPAIYEIETLHAVVLQLVNESQKEIVWATDTPNYPKEELSPLLTNCISTQRIVKSHNKLITAFPLYIETGENTLCIGAMAFYTPVPLSEREELINELMVRYIALVLWQAVVYRLRQYDTLEEAEDERRRARYEEEQLHVQNMVLDNCLSTLKHETMYYPNRIKQIVGQLRAPNHEQVAQMREMVEYYKQIFTLLSNQAARQVELVNFRRNHIEVESLLGEMRHYTQHMGQKQQKNISLKVVTEPSLGIMADRDMVRLLLENLITASIKHQPKKSTLQLRAIRAENFVRITLYDSHFETTKEELDNLFSPHVARIPYLLCKQIIRDHDDYSSHIGCRIYAQKHAEIGTEIWFTLPQIEIK